MQFNSIRQAAFVFLVFTGFLSGCSQQDLPKADYVFTNAVVYTVNDHQPWAEAVAIKENRITYVGPQAGTADHIGPNTEVIDVQGNMILPGFIDSHVHPIWGGNTLLEINLRQAKTVEKAKEILAEYRAQNPDAAYITGGAWKIEYLSPDELRKEDIDEVVSDIPVILYDHYGHTAWVNSKAFELAGLGKSLVDPEGGQFDRDSETGELTGIVREYPAYKMIEKAIPDNEQHLHEKSLKKALEYLNKNGVTSFLNAYMVGDPLGEAFVRLFKNGELTARTVLSFRVNTEQSVRDTLARLEKRRATIEALDPNFLSAGTVKLFVDGTILNQTAAMIDPYVGGFRSFESKGYLFSDEELRSYVVALDKEGYQLHFHTIGDGAARQALNTMEYTEQVNGKKKRRAGISHLTIVSPDDFPRFKELNVYANLQFLWARHTKTFARVEERVGAERSRHFYAYGDLYRAGAPLIAGSDWPVSSANPFAAMQIAATRPYSDETAPAMVRETAWLPEQRVLDIETLIRAFTINGARWQSREDSIGSLEVGKLADLVVVDQNIMEIPVSDISKTKVLTTMVDGKIVYEK